MQDFDRHIKDLLEDAEVEVPSGVWEAVSAGLDRADAKKKIIVPPMWWRRAGLAIAAAAAAVAGVFLFTGKDNSTDLPYFNSLISQDSPAAFDVVLTPAKDISLGGRSLAMAQKESASEKITEEAVCNSSAKFLPANSVLIAMYGATVGEYGILAHSMTCNQAVCALLPNDNYPYTYLLGWAICYKQDLINLATGAAQQNISQDLIKQQMVCTDYKLIRSYDEQVRPYIKKIKSNKQQILTLSVLRDTLLTRLLSSEVKVVGQ